MLCSYHNASLFLGAVQGEPNRLGAPVCLSYSNKVSPTVETHLMQNLWHPALGLSSILITRHGNSINRIDSNGINVLNYISEYSNHRKKNSVSLQHSPRDRMLISILSPVSTAVLLLTSGFLVSLVCTNHSWE